MNAKNFIDAQVLYVVQRYDMKLNRTEKKYILGLLNKTSPEEMMEYLNKEYTIDHSYMAKTIEELKVIVANVDKVKNTLELQRTMPDLLDINPISKFTNTETEYAQRVFSRYVEDLAEIENQDDIEKFLSTKIKNYDKNIEKYIPYFHNGQVWSMQNLATYNSMLYNVNLTRTAWNQTYKDSQVLDNEKFIINPHPFACPHCEEHMGRILTKEELEELVGYAVDETSTEILHPNCKCTLGLYWTEEQKQDVNLTSKEDYDLDQRDKAIDRIIKKKEVERDLYKEVGNTKMANRRDDQIWRLVKEQQDIEERLKQIRQKYYK